jgi:predicted TIM-barrel enzyme
VLGSGVTAENLAGFFPAADAFIIGTHFKVDNRWDQTVDPRRVEAFMHSVRQRRAAQS